MDPSPSSFLNLGIVAHVDAGKTSLTERLLYDAGALEVLGSVDAGTTRTDSMALERRRGITIRSAVTTFGLGDLMVNLVDTPGHPDFIAEVERSLGILDAAVLVLSAVEGVQPQSVAIWRALRRVGVPTVLFVNKVDRAGADVDRVLTQVRRRLAPRVVALARPAGAGRRDARVIAVPLTDESVVAAVAEVDDRLLERWLRHGAVRRHDVAIALRRGVAQGALAPALCGSALTGAGLPQVREVLTQVLPRAARPGGPVAGSVFAVDRDDGGRRAWLRLWSGELRVRDRVVEGSSERVTELAVSAPGGVAAATAAVPGQVVAVRGPTLRVGDAVGCPPPRRTHRFPPGAFEALVEPEDPTRRTALYAALAELADEDPLIDLRLDEIDGEAAVTLHGEVQKEVIAALLQERYGVAARFTGTSVVCLERVAGVGSALERVGADDNPYLAGIGLRVEAAAVGSGVEFRAGAEPGRLPPAFVAATEEGLRSALRQGLHGWRVTDCVVTMTDSQYFPRQSKPHQKFDKSISSVAADFRLLAPVVVMAALSRAGTTVCQPIDRFELDLPEASLPATSSLLARMRAVVAETAVSNGYVRLTGDLPSASAPGLAARLPDLTGGEAVLTTRQDHHAPVADRPPPRRRRSGWDPLDRKTWFRRMPR